MNYRFKSCAVVGKFMPPHVGHEYLINFALQMSQTVTVLVDCVRGQGVDASVRAQWMREHWASQSRVSFIAIDHPTPQSPEEFEGTKEEFFSYWADIFNTLAPSQAIIGSMEYVQPLAKACNREYVILDVGRESIEMSATKIRDNIALNFEQLLPTAREHFVKTICFVGPEATGKTVMAKNMAAHFKTTWASEFAQGLIVRQKGVWNWSDVVTTACAQSASVSALKKRANYLLFCDSDLNTTAWWSQAVFNKIPSEIEQMAQNESYDLTFLMYPNTQWVSDIHRGIAGVDSGLQSKRVEFFNFMKDKLTAQKRQFVVIEQESWDSRTEEVKKIIKNRFF